MPLSWLSKQLMASDHTLEDLAAVKCTVLLTKGTETGEVERRVVDLLALHLPNARVVELQGSHAHSSRASIDSSKHSRNISKPAWPPDQCQGRTEARLKPAVFMWG